MPEKPLKTDVNVRPLGTPCLETTSSGETPSASTTIKLFGTTSPGTPSPAAEDVALTGEAAKTANKMAAKIAKIENRFFIVCPHVLEV